MVRNYKRVTDRITPSTSDMIAAAKAVKRENEPLSLRKAAEEFNVHYKALERFCKRISNTELEADKCNFKLGYKKPGQVFTESEEEM